MLKVGGHVNIFNQEQFANFCTANEIDASVDQNYHKLIGDDGNINFEETDLFSHKNICMVHLHCALEKTIDIPLFGLQILCSIFKCDMHILQSFSRQQKSIQFDKKSLNYGRFWYGSLQKDFVKAFDFDENYGVNVDPFKTFRNRNMVIVKFQRLDVADSNPHHVYCPFQFGGTPLHTLFRNEIRSLAEHYTIEDDKELPTKPVFGEIPAKLKAELTKNRDKFTEDQLTETQSRKKC